MYKKMKDERITKEQNKIIAPMYGLILLLTAMCVVVKYIFFTHQLVYYILDGLAVSISMIYLISRCLFDGISIMLSKDENIKEIQDKYCTQSLYICFWIYITGQFALFLLRQEKIEAIGLYFFVWGIPALIITIKCIKNGLFVWGTKKRKKKGIAEFRKRTVIGSLFYGIFMRWVTAWSDSGFSLNLKDILAILGMAAMWGIPFYFIMKLFMDKSEKISDKKVADIESSNE